MDCNTVNKFFHLLNRKFNSIVQKCNEKYQNKFELLSTSKYHRRKTNKDSWFRNLFDIQIPSDVVDIVSLGPNYSAPQKISKQHVIDTIKNIESSFLSLDINSDLKNEIREKVTNNIMHNFNKDTHISMEDRNFANKLKVTKQFLKNNRDIFLPLLTKVTLLFV